MTTVIQQIPDFIEFLGRSDSVLKHFQNMSSNYEDIINKKYNNNDNDLSFDNIRFENVSFSYKSNKTLPFFKLLSPSIQGILTLFFSVKIVLLE